MTREVLFLMDEILGRQPTGNMVPSLSVPRSEGAQKSSRQSSFRRFLAAAQASSVLLRRQGSRVFHRIVSSLADRPILGPLPFLAITAALGITAIVSTVYTPAYAVTVDGVMLGTVTKPVVFERVVDRVESRASTILGHEYTIDSQINYQLALVRRDQVSSISGFETYLFNQIGEVMKSYVLTVNGEVIGAAADQTNLDALLDQIKVPYLTADTISSDFTSQVRITREYISTDTLQDTSKMAELLVQNTTGETTYEVAKGDTFMAIAYDNGMTMAELEDLNPDVNVDKLSIGQLLNVKEIIPFLSVRTVDRVTYEEEVACPVEEVNDNTMYQGETRVITKGVPGLASIQADVTYVNGKEQERDVLSTTVLSEPTTKVVAVGTKARPSWYPNGYFVWPLSGNITSSFGYRTIFGTYEFHSGIDIATSYGSSIRAADGGTVIFAGYKGSYGKLIIIDHGNGYQTYYGHCSSLLVSTGSKVYQGQTIGRVGTTGRATGPPCHFEIRVNGTPLNPRRYLP